MVSILLLLTELIDAVDFRLKQLDLIDVFGDFLLVLGLFVAPSVDI
jgi:hypothetical protein